MATLVSTEAPPGTSSVNGPAKMDSTRHAASSAMEVVRMGRTPTRHSSGGTAQEGR